MIRKLITVATLAAICLVSLAPVAFAFDNDYAQNVARVSDPSPTTVDSRINDYIYQSEDIMLDKSSGVVRVLRTDQKVNLNDFVTEVITLDNASPRELRGLARTICRKEGGDADTLWDRVNRQTGKPIPKENMKETGKALVVVCPSFQLPFIKKTLKAIDQEWVHETEDGSWKHYYRAKHRDIRKIMDILFVYATPDARFSIDLTNNAVLRFDQPCIRPLWEMGLNEVDVPPNQLSLDVEIYELSNYNDLNLGVDYQAWKNGPGARLFRFVFYNEDTRVSGGSGTVPTRTESWWRFSSYDFALTSAFVDFLRTKGRAKLLTQTAITAKSGEAAGIALTNGVVSFVSSEGSIAPVVQAPADSVSGYQEYFHFDNTDEPLTVSLPDWTNRKLSYQATGSTGLFLAMAPVVGRESAIVDISLSVNDIAGYTPSGTPIVSERKMSSQFEVQDNVPLVFGGINKNANTEQRVGIPYLMNIPLIGKYVFGRTVKTDDMTKMVVYLTPRFKVFAMDDADSAVPDIVNTAKLAKQASLSNLGTPKTDYGFDQWLLDRDR